MHRHNLRCGSYGIDAGRSPRQWVDAGLAEFGCSDITTFVWIHFNLCFGIAGTVELTLS